MWFWLLLHNIIYYCKTSSDADGISYGIIYIILYYTKIILHYYMLYSKKIFCLTSIIELTYTRNRITNDNKKILNTHNM